MNYQHCHAILYALDIISEPELVAIRVEGVEDVMDLEIHAASGVQVARPVPSDTVVVRAVQLKSRLAPYTWARGELLAIFRRWASLKVAETATFELVTEAALGPSGVRVVEALDAARSGDLTSVASLLDVDPMHPACQVMARVHVRADPAVLSRCCTKQSARCVPYFLGVAPRWTRRPRPRRQLIACSSCLRSGLGSQPHRTGSLRVTNSSKLLEA